MHGRKRGSLHRCLGILLVVAALFAPGSALLADGDDHTEWKHEPITLRDHQIPTYELFETFLLHASFVHETGDAEAYREFLADYGLSPDMEAVQTLHLAFDAMEASGHKHSGEHRAEQLGRIFAGLLAAVENDRQGIDGRGLWFELIRNMQPKVSWIFPDEHPDFQAIEDAEGHFREAISGTLGPSFLAVQPAFEPDYEKSDDHDHGLELAGSRYKISHLGNGPAEGDLDHAASHARFEWRRYADEDGSVRVIGLVDSGVDPRSMIDMTFSSDEDLRAELKHGGIVGMTRFSETIELELAAGDKSHTSLGCVAAGLAAAAACVACATPPDPITCAACVAALAAVAATCNQPHCNQVQCNTGCVQACHLYGVCSSTSGSSSPADCSCVGQRYDIPGCEPPFPCNDLQGGLATVGLVDDINPIICHPCSVTVTEVSMLRLDGSDPVVMPTDVVVLGRLEKSDMVHGEEPMSYLMAEWAVVDFGGPRSDTKASSPVRALRSSVPSFAAAQVRMLGKNLPGVTGLTEAPDDRLAIMVASPPHDANSREIPMPDLKLGQTALPAGTARGRVAIRADFSEAGALQGFEILADTMGGVSPQLAAQIEQALVLERKSDKEHRVVAFAVLSVDDELRIDSNLKYLPKCCCGGNFCV